MEWNSDDSFVKWVTRAYVIAVLVGMPLLFYLILGEL